MTAQEEQLKQKEAEAIAQVNRISIEQERKIIQDFLNFVHEEYVGKLDIDILQTILNEDYRK